MRSMLLSIMFCLISSVSWAMLHSTDNTLWTDFIKNPSDGLVYKKFQATPFTGTLNATADDPIQRSYKDGSKHGEWVEFDANGLVKSKSLFEDGQLRSKSNYKDGEQHGLAEGYYESGQLRSKSNYKDGEQHGLAEEYYESGQVSQRRNYKDGKLYRDGKLFSGLVEWHYENGQLGSKENYKDGKLHGLWEFFKEDGSLIY